MAKILFFGLSIRLTKHGRYTAAAKKQRRDALWARRELILRQKTAAKTARQEWRELKLALKAWSLID